MTFTGLTEAEKNTAAAGLDSVLTSSSSASDFFGEDVEEVSYTVVQVIAAPPSAPPSNAGLIGGVVGGISGCLFGVLGFGIWYMKKGKRSVGQGSPGQG